MSDTALNKIIQYGTTAARLAFTPNPATGSKVLYIWYDTNSPPDTYVWDGAAWVKISGSGSGTLTVPNGGTGATTLTGILVGTGATPVTSVTIPGDATKFLNGAATPVFAQVKGSDLLLADVTTNDVSSTAHGFAPKSPADATTFLNGAATPVYAQVKDSDIAFTDITTNNVSITKHGFAPKAPNDATKFLNGVGTYSVPTGSGGGSLLSALVNITDAQFRASNTVPIQILAAPGAGKVTIPLFFQIIEEIVTSFSVAVNLNIRYVGGVGSGLVALSTQSNGAAGKKLGRSSAVAVGTITSPGIENVAMEVFGSAVSTGGSTINGFNVYMEYVTISWP